MKILEKVHTDGINDVNALVYVPTIPKTDTVDEVASEYINYTSEAEIKPYMAFLSNKGRSNLPSGWPQIPCPNETTKIAAFPAVREAV